MSGNVNHGRIYYRCKASRDYVRQHGIARPPVLYVRQEPIVHPVDRFLSQEFGRGRRTETVSRIADASYRAALAEHQQHDEAPKLRDSITECNAKIERYRAALDADDPCLSRAGSARRRRSRKRHRRDSVTEAPPQRMSEEEVAAMVDAFGGLLGLLQQTEPNDRAEIYARIGLHMFYRPGTETVLAEVRSRETARKNKTRLSGECRASTAFV